MSSPSSGPQLCAHITSQLCPHTWLGSPKLTPLVLVTSPSQPWDIQAKATPAWPPSIPLEFLFSLNAAIWHFLSQTTGVNHFRVEHGEALCWPSWMMLSTSPSSRKASVVQLLSLGGWEPSQTLHPDPFKLENPSPSGGDKVTSASPLTHLSPQHRCSLPRGGSSTHPQWDFSMEDGSYQPRSTWMMGSAGTSQC